jgi:hypothetical protein
MGRVTKGIPVRDSNGDRLLVYAMDEEGRVPIIGLRRKFVRFELETGERVQLIDDDTFLLIDSGEKLMRLK